MDAKYLDAQTEASLVSAWQQDGDLDARARLVAAFQDLVRKLASRTRVRSGPLFDDLVSEGNIGLMRAIDSFDLGRRHRLSTYATWWIKARIVEYARNQASIVKVVTTGEQKRLYGKAPSLRARYELGPELTASQIITIARDQAVSETNVVRVMTSGRDLSIDAAPRDDDTGQWQNMLVDPVPDPETAIIVDDEVRKQRALIVEALEGLNDRERRIVLERHLTDRPLKLRELGALFGTTHERVRQIEAKALAKLRRHVMSADLSVGL